MSRFMLYARRSPTLSQVLHQVRSSSTRPGSSVKDGSFVIQPVGAKDMVGPPDPVSNIRPILIHIPPNESELEKNYRLQRDAVQKWNQEFWSKHNLKFVKEREKYIKDSQKTSIEEEGNAKTMTADEMSVFYKKFLDDNWRVHVDYNKEWYKKNIGLMLFSYKVLMFKCFQSLRNGFQKLK